MCASKFNRGWTKRTGSLARVVDAVMWQQRSLRTAIIGRLRRLLCGLSFTNAHINARKRARYAILLDSVWQDVAKDIYISDVVRFLPTGDKFNDDDSSSVPHCWLADVGSFTLQKRVIETQKSFMFRLIPKNSKVCKTNERTIPLFGSID